MKTKLDLLFSWPKHILEREKKKNPKNFSKGINVISHSLWLVADGKPKTYFVTISRYSGVI